MSTQAGYVPSTSDRAYIEATSASIHPALAAIEEAAGPADIPILDRESGRLLTVLAGGRRRIVEIGTAYGYSTLCLALGQPDEGTIVTIDPDRSRTDLARGWWRQAGIRDERIVVINRPALEALGDDGPEAELDGPFDLAFIDAIKVEYGAYVDALVPRLARGALVAADNVLYGGSVSGDTTTRAGDSADALRAFNAVILRDPRFDATIVPVGDGLLVASFRG